MTTLDELVSAAQCAPQQGRRKLVALAGPPASGKSTLAKRVLAALGPTAALVEMDGFHLDNRQLDRLGLRARKGAPETFDAGGFARLVSALQADEDIYVPLFDRERDLAVAGAGRVPRDCDTVVLEGNYLLYDAPVWRDVARNWDFSVRLCPPDEVLRARLVARWIAHGSTPRDAAIRAERNDMANAALTRAAALPATLSIEVDVT